MLARNLRAAGGRRDPAFNEVALLLHGDGDPAAPTFVDSSRHRRVPTVFGDPQLLTGAIVFNQAIDFDGDGDYLGYDDAPDLRIGTADFCIELMFRLKATGVAGGLLGKGVGSTSGFNVLVRENGSVRFTWGATNNIDTPTDFIESNTATLYYYSMSRSAGTLSRFTQKKLFNATNWANGVFSSIGANSYNFNDTQPLYVGAGRTGGNNLNGYIEELRFTIGAARSERPLEPYPDR